MPNEEMGRVLLPHDFVGGKCIRCGIDIENSGILSSTCSTRGPWAGPTSIAYFAFQVISLAILIGIIFLLILASGGTFIFPISRHSAPYFLGLSFVIIGTIVIRYLYSMAKKIILDFYTTLYWNKLKCKLFPWKFFLIINGLIVMSFSVYADNEYSLIRAKEINSSPRVRILSGQRYHKLYHYSGRGDIVPLLIAIEKNFTECDVCRPRYKLSISYVNTPDYLMNWPNYAALLTVFVWVSAFFIFYHDLEVVSKQKDIQIG